MNGQRQAAERQAPAATSLNLHLANHAGNSFVTWRLSDESVHHVSIHNRRNVEADDVACSEGIS